MERAEILELYEVPCRDIILLSSSSSSNSREEIERLETVRETLMERLGPTGPGLISITGVPNSHILRRNLLPLARTLALLDHHQRNPILKEHNLGSDVPLKDPDRNVTSFAMQLKYAEVLESTQNMIGHSVGPSVNLECNHVDVDGVRDLGDNEFKNLGNVFKELGFCMMEIGLCLARICDKAIGGQELEQSLLESGTAKARLIHYHSALDRLVLREAGRKNVFAKRLGSNKMDQENSVKSEHKQPGGSKLFTNGPEVGLCGIHSNLWQQWHYDYGIFTVLTDPMFLLPSYSPEAMAEEQFSLSCDQECASPSGDSYLQIFDPSKNKIFMVKTSPGSFILQVGEWADILSKGKLCSTLHCVCRPEKLEKLSRETFVVFLQPTWSKTFSVSDYPFEHHKYGGHCFPEKNNLAEKDQNQLTREIRKIVPPLS
ncbi:hypothetical protein CFOL_v3_28433 [Cephalotus follicularis]|uniref:2OG-FeII_Oxy domain-containing protein/DIOX_N domain-containing protein n=1 Tax=Cephalotus follicularis TaxID=3775 RepID=A0A1Q3CY66_CEPFO|nr:hypothetical protein CFOL_v3_28433 [Cephalotus follicularis]